MKIANRTQYLVQPLYFTSQQYNSAIFFYTCYMSNIKKKSYSHIQWENPISLHCPRLNSGGNLSSPPGHRGGPIPLLKSEWESRKASKKRTKKVLSLLWKEERSSIGTTNLVLARERGGHCCQWSLGLFCSFLIIVEECCEETKAPWRKNRCSLLQEVVIYFHHCLLFFWFEKS